MTAFDRLYGGLKAMMLMNERFDRVDSELKSLADDLGAMASSHGELAQRVAVIEGYIRGRADQAAMQVRIGKDPE